MDHPDSAVSMAGRFLRHGWIAWTIPGDYASCFCCRASSNYHGTIDPTNDGAFETIDEAQQACLGASPTMCNGIASVQEGPNGPGWYTQSGPVNVDRSSSGTYYQRRDPPDCHASRYTPPAAPPPSIPNPPSPPWPPQMPPTLPPAPPPTPPSELLIFLLTAILPGLVVLVTILSICKLRKVRQRKQRVAAETQMLERFANDVKPKIEAEIAQLPTLRWYLGCKAGDECAVCLQDYTEGDELRELQCGHSFHHKCIDKWLLDARINHVAPATRGAPISACAPTCPLCNTLLIENICETIEFVTHPPRPGQGPGSAASVSGDTQLTSFSAGVIA